MDRARKVRKTLPVSPCDIRGLEAWLEEQANAGLFPVSIGSWAVFTTDGVPGTRFRLEPYDRGRTAPTEEQQELYRRAGWSYALNVAPAGCWLFYTADPAAVELYSDHESRGLSLERLERAARRAWQRSLLLGVVLAAVSVWLLLFWSGGMAARGGLPLVWLRVFDPTFLVLLPCQGMAFGRSCRNARLLRRACQALRLGMDMPPSAEPSGRIVWENVIFLAAVFLLALLLAGQWMERRGVPLEDFRQPYVELQELESTPVVLFDPSSGHDSRAYREHSLLAPAWYSITQQARSPENGASCYAPQLEAMYFRLLLPSMARSVAQAQMEQYRLVNLSWSYETLEHPGLDFVLLAREPEGLWQMAALGRGGQVAVYLYCGQEQLRDHLDLLSSWVR